MDQRACKKSGQTFEITEKDKDFYTRMNVPLPTLSPQERQRRRLAWRNERTLYQRKCSGTGKSIIGMYPSDTKFPVYSHEYFFSDKWNAKNYGRDFDFNKPFFEQFAELLKVAPRILNYSFSNENAEYGNLSSWNKNCYMCFEADNNRDCLYSDYSFRCANVVDCSYTKESELCYQCTDISKCYNLRYSTNCINCADAWFLRNCTGCKSCFGCVNMHNKQYYFLNEKLTKEEYFAKLDSLNFSSYEAVQKLWESFLEFSKKYPHKYINGFQNENSTGDYLNNCKNAEFCFDSSELRDCKFVFNCERIKDSYDLDTYGGIEGAELAYECHSVGRGSFNVAFGNNVYQNLINAYYCDNCADSRDIFGCISLHHGEYCILNKQYSKDEYFNLREKIVRHMETTGEWGEFFPIEISPFAYNETTAQEYYPMTKEEITEKGYKWKEKDKKEYKKQNYIVLASINEVDDAICNEILACKETGKNFKIQQLELGFYRKMGLPVPIYCPDERHLRRLQFRNPRQLWDRKCDKCGVNINTSYSQDRHEIIYCEKCYLETII